MFIKTIVCVLYILASHTYYVMPLNVFKKKYIKSLSLYMYIF